MLTSTLESKNSASVLAGGRMLLSSGIVLPIRRGINDPVGVFSKGTFVEGATVVVRVLPYASISFFTITAKIRPYSVDGSWDGADFNTDYTAYTENIGAALLANRGVLEYDLSREGPFSFDLTLQNNALAPIPITGQILVFSKNSAITTISSVSTSPDGTRDSVAPRLLRREVQQLLCPTCSAE